MKMLQNCFFFHSHFQNGKLQLQIDGDGKCIDVNRRLKLSASTCRWMMSLRINFHCRKAALRKVVNWKPSLQAQHNYCLQHSTMMQRYESSTWSFEAEAKSVLFNFLVENLSITIFTVCHLLTIVTSLFPAVNCADSLQWNKISI